jgi:predicted acyltransferase
MWLRGNVAAMSPIAAPPASVRLTSLDQFRGYTMFGMLLVNFLGQSAICPRILKHTHDYCSYADTIMPQFLFAAGFAMRLSLGKRMAAGGKMPWGRALRRIGGLAIVAIAWYTFCDFNDIVKKIRVQPFGQVLQILFKRELFQTLLHIAATSLWILPVMTSSARVRIMYALFSGILHLVVSQWFNFVWVNTSPGGIDGGPLGFLTWSIPAICGTLACDAVRASGASAARRIAVGGTAVMLIGWVMSCGTVLYDIPVDQIQAAPPLSLAVNTLEMATPDIPPDPLAVVKSRTAKLAPDPVIPSAERWKRWDGAVAEPPFVPPPDLRHRQWNYWMMSQRSGNLSYLTFTGGVSLLVYALFLWVCDNLGWRLSLFRTLGTNSLAAYLLHDIASWLISPSFSQKSWLTSIVSRYTTQGTATAIVTLAGFACFALFVYAICRMLERRGWYIRV